MEEIEKQIEELRDALPMMRKMGSIDEAASGTIHDSLNGILELVKNLNIDIDSNFVLLAKPNYKAKDGTIKRGIEIVGKYYAPQNDC